MKHKKKYLKLWELILSISRIKREGISGKKTYKSYIKIDLTLEEHKVTKAMNTGAAQEIKTIRQS